MLRHRQGLICALAALGLSNLAAQDAPVGPAIVVTGARTAQSVEQALVPVQLITRADIERSAATSVVDVLRMLAALDVNQSGGMGAQTSVFMRGGDARHTLVLVDGMPINRVDFGSASIEHVPLGQVERIEIVRGNLSALYGSQAVGGVIHIFTRRADGPRANAALGGERSHALDLAYGAGLGSGAQTGQWRLSLSERATRGVSAQNPASYPGANPDRDGYRNRSLALGLQWPLSADARLDIDALAGDTRTDYDNAFAALPRPRIEQSSELFGLRYAQRLSDAWRLAAGWQASNERFDDPAGWTKAGRNRTRLMQVELMHQASATAQWQFGLERRSQQFDDRPVSAARADRDLDAVRLAWVGALGRGLDAQFNLRHDRVQGVKGSDAATTGAAALGYALAPGWRATARWSTSFSVPSSIDLQYATPAGLKPERGRHAELGLQYQQAGWRVQAQFYRQQLRDKVDFDPITFASVNIGRARDKGVELSLAAPTGAVGPGHLQVELAQADPRNAQTGERLARRARTRLSLAYTGDWAGFGYGAYLRHVGERIDIDPATFKRRSNGAQTRLDLSLSRTLSPQWTLAAKLVNAGDERRDEVLGYSAQPRQWWLELRYAPR